MKKFKHTISVLFIVVTLFSCESDLVDFTDVTNPNLSESSVIGQPNSSVAWLVGIQRQMANVSNGAVTISEIASDNYTNTQTFFNQFLDNLTIDFQDNNMATLQFAIARLREMATFGIDKVAPNDINTTNTTLAEFNFYKGISYLMAAEYFSFLPAEENRTPLTSTDNFQLAISSFTNAINLQDDAKYQLALARVYHNLGDKNNAVTFSNSALALDSNLLFQIDFDQGNGPVSTIEGALFARGSFDDLQPLPILDFLDPKYSFLSNIQDQSTPFLKAEEAYFIIAEAKLSDNDLNGAQTTLKDLVTLIGSRPTRIIDDTVEGRDQDFPGSRPNNSSVQVKYLGDATFKSGLVLDRDASVTVPIISGTSITNALIDNLTTIDEALEMLYLMRQEVFIAEGRRVLDLGIKYVIHENEMLLNPAIDENHAGLTGVIPPFIDVIKTELDAFTYDVNANTAEVLHNVNKILVANKASDFVIPFF